MTHQPARWTREAFICTLPRACLKCHHKGVICTDKDLVRQEDGHTTTLALYRVAICMNRECSAVYAQQPHDGTRYGSGFTYGRSEVIFVDTLPYHIPLGGEVGRILDRNAFVLEKGTSILVA